MKKRIREWKEREENQGMEGERREEGRTWRRGRERRSGKEGNRREGRVREANRKMGREKGGEGCANNTLSALEGHVVKKGERGVQ